MLEHVETGRKFQATASDQYTAVVGLLLAPVSPFLLGGAMKTWTRLGNHLYQQLADQGAFDPSSWSAEERAPRQAEEVAPPPGPAPTGPSATTSPPPSSADGADPEAQRLRRLEKLRDEGLISQDEYERKRGEVLDDL